LPKTARTWTGARTPSGLKRVRQAETRREVLQPRRSAAKTLVAKALRVSAQPNNGSDANVALIEALSALDRAAKSGAIHPNAAARRKSRLTRHVNQALGGVSAQTGAHAAKTTSKAQAAKAARARIAASKADKAKGAQTAAGKARAALTKTTRTEGSATAQATEAAAPAALKPRAAARPAAKTTTAKKAPAKTTKAAAPKATAKKTTAKAAPKKASKG
jgi:DNA-binding protein HU-beta